MLTVFRICGAIVIGASLFLSSPAIAQAQQAGDQAAERFSRFLNNHPNVAAELERNPNQVNDEKFLADHPALQKFLQTHPGVQKQVAESPGTVTNSNGQYLWNKRGAISAARAHNYLLEHPEVAREVQSNPSLLDSQDYLDAHPGLRDFMKQHPNMRAEMKEHPYGFVSQRRKGYLPPAPPAQ